MPAPRWFQAMMGSRAEIFTEKQRLRHEAFLKLKSLMQRISQECYAAGWMNQLEYYVWQIATGKRTHYGLDDGVDRYSGLLWDYAQECEGWVTWDESIAEPIWISQDNWRKMFFEWARAQRTLCASHGYSFKIFGSHRPTEGMCDVCCVDDTLDVLLNGYKQGVENRINGLHDRITRLEGGKTQVEGKS